MRQPNTTNMASRFGRTAWRLGDRAATGVLVLAAVALSVVVGSHFLGYRLLIVESGSMVPTMRVGDLVLSKTVAPMSVHPGAIVTFRDVTRHDELVTHRVIRMVPDGPVVHFTTKGDANKVGEHWSVPKAGHIGREVLILPEAGWWLADLTTTTFRLVAIWVLVASLAFAILRRIWRRTPAAGGSDKRSTRTTNRTPTVLAPASRTQAAPTAANHTPTALTAANYTQAAPTAANHTQAAPTAANVAFDSLSSARGATRLGGSKPDPAARAQLATLIAEVLGSPIDPDGTRHVPASIATPPAGWLVRCNGIAGIMSDDECASPVENAYAPV